MIESKFTNEDTENEFRVVVNETSSGVELKIPSRRFRSEIVSTTNIQRVRTPINSGFRHKSTKIPIPNEGELLNET